MQSLIVCSNPIPDPSNSCTRTPKFLCICIVYVYDIHFVVDDADQCDGPTGVENPQISLDVALDTRTEHEDGDDARSDGQLDHQDPVHSADEVPPDGFISKSGAEAERRVNEERARERPYQMKSLNDLVNFYGIN